MQNNLTTRTEELDPEGLKISPKAEAEQTPETSRVSPSLDIKKRPVVFGEILFDTFEDGKRVLGGAAFNVAWNLKGFGLNPFMISSIGKEDAGEEILDRMNAWGMDTNGVQIDPEHETGTVEVNVSNGQPSYNIKPDQAYDHLDASKALDVISGHTIPCLYHGSLALRGDGNKQTLEEIKQQVAAPIVLDLNLREPWWTSETVESCMTGATWAKLNDDELIEITRSEASNATDLNQLGMDTLKKYDLAGLLVTRGSEGATWLSDDSGMVSVPAAKVETLIDTVGAGDAFCSVLMLGLLLDWNMPTCLERASRFASRVCGMQGATSDQPNLYTDQLERWQKEEC